MQNKKDGPRPVTVGTCTLAPFNKEGSEERLTNGLDMIERMAQKATDQGTSLDLAVLPEHFAQSGGDRRALAEKIDGRTITACAEKCLRHRTYAAVPLLLDEGDSFANAVMILDRDGNPAGTYRKVYPVLHLDGTLEGGVSPGRDFPVFDLDFGRVGVQICYDVSFPRGWQAYKEQQADLVVFSSATSAVSRLKAYAWDHHYYIVASTFRAPTVIVDPIGVEVARTYGDREVLVAGIDLDYRIVPWNYLRDFGKALAEKYGDTIRQDWHYEEDLCILTSRDPELPIGEVMEKEGMHTLDEHIEENRQAQDKARGE